LKAAGAGLDMALAGCSIEAPAVRRTGGVRPDFFVVNGRVNRLIENAVNVLTTEPIRFINPTLRGNLRTHGIRLSVCAACAPPPSVPTTCSYTCLTSAFSYLRMRPR